MKTNISLALLAVCELAQVTQDGKLSLLGIFSRLMARRVPMRIPRFYMVGMLTGAPLTESKVSFQIIGPSSQNAIQEFQAKVRLGFDGKANVLNELTNTTLTDFGTYTVILNINGQRLGATEFVVAQPEEPDLKRSSSTIPN